MEKGTANGKTVNVELNGSMKTIESNTTLLVLIRDILKENTNGIAIAINGSVIPKTKWETTSIQEADRIELVRATQGG